MREQGLESQGRTSQREEGPLRQWRRQTWSAGLGRLRVCVSDTPPGRCQCCGRVGWPLHGKGIQEGELDAGGQTLGWRARWAACCL